MRKLVVLTLVLALPIFFGCEKRKFYFNVNLNKTEVFTINQTGAFSVNKIITEADILQLLDIPTDATITEINIQSISLKAEVKSGNQATSILVSGKVGDVGSQQFTMFNNTPVVLAGVNVPFIGLNSLLAVGVNKLKNKINGYVNQIDNNSMVIELTGDSSPTTGQHVFVDLLFKITATIKYSECLDSFTAFGDDCE